MVTIEWTCIAQEIMSRLGIGVIPIPIAVAPIRSATTLTDAGLAANATTVGMALTIHAAPVVRAFCHVPSQQWQRAL